MSEPGPESIPTSADPRSKRPVKRRAITPLSEHASQIEHLFRDPSKEIRLPGASKERTAASLAAPPEIVANVQGSSAGAGSGEFHVYKASRRREYERLRLMQSEVDREKEDEDWEAKVDEAKRKDEEKTGKNRKRREKRNAAKNKSNNKGGAAGATATDGVAVDGPNPGAPKLSDREKDGLASGYGPGESTEVPGIIIHDE